MPLKKKGDKRLKTRVEFATQIVLTVGESKIHVEGSSKDLSLKGMFVNTQEKLPVGAKCHVEVILTGMTEKVILQMQGEIVRKERAGIAVIFKAIDVDSYTHLKNIVRYNAADADEVV